MEGYLDTSRTDATLVTITGLPASPTGYDVYVYIDGDNPGATRTGAYQISGSSLSPSTMVATDGASANFAGAFVSANGTAGTYLKFSVQSTNFTLTATPATSTDSFVRAPINAMQIVPSPAGP